MPSPFPGFDPYLESQGHWPDFRAQFIADCRGALNHVLPSHYVARIDKRITLLEPLTGTGCELRPDVSIVREETRVPARQQAGTLTLEPACIPFQTAHLEETRETFIEIVRLPERQLVTVIEVLSPANKAEPGRSQYLAKRVALVGQPVNLVELDFLLGGQRLPMARPLPPGDYYAFVARSDHRPDCDVYAWSIQHPLPTIPIPLNRPDPDVALDLAGAFVSSYESGRYARLMRYGAPLALPLADDARDWAEKTAKAAAR